MRFIKLLILSWVIIQSNSNYAWNALGHMVVANIAYEHLQPNVRIKIDKMVRDLGKEYPDISNFNEIAPWPDSLRSQKIEMFTHWHYVDVPFSSDATPVKNISHTDNAIWAIEHLQPIIKNTKANPFEKARFLAFLVHIVGDLHQPLHAVGRISVANPNGDQGGNLFFVKYPPEKPQKMTLHKLWDQGFHLFTISPTPQNVALLSQNITSFYPPEHFGEKLNDLAPNTWAAEGLTIAMSSVYNTPEDQLPNEGYLRVGEAMTKERVALAGYRLAKLLNRLLK